MSPRELVDRHYQMINGNDYHDFDDVFSPDVEVVTPGSPPFRGKADVLAHNQAFQAACPDGHIELRGSAESGETIFVEGRFTGTHSGPLVGPGGTIPPTGRKLDLPFAGVYRVSDSRIVSYHDYFDQVTFMQQLGLMPGAGERD